MPITRGFRLACATLVSLSVSGCEEQAVGVRASKTTDLNCSGVVDPGLTGRITDHAEVIDAGAERRLDQRLSNFERATGHQIVAVTVRSLDGMPIKPQADCLANIWGIGDARRNDGIMILVSPSDRKVRIALGLHFGTRDPDPRAAGAIAAMTPHFARDDFASGLDSGLDVLERELQ